MRPTNSNLERRWRTGIAAGAAALLLAAAGCGGGGDGGRHSGAIVQPPLPPAASPGIAITLGAANVSLERGSSIAVAVTISRTGGYEGPVNLAVGALPEGITATLDPATVAFGASESRLTLSATGTAEGSHHITVTATGLAVGTRSASLGLTVVAPAAPAIEFQPLADDMFWTVQGDTWDWPISIARIGGFSGSVALSVDNQPQGVEAYFDPATLDPATTTTTLYIAAAADAPPGVTPVTLRARGAGIADATVVIRLVVFPPAR